MMNQRNRAVAWRLHTAYNYGATAPAELPDFQVPERQHNVEKRKAQKTRISVSVIQFALTIGVVLSLCAVNTMLARVFVANSNYLIRLKQQEARLLNENETLKIDVGRLKSPDRIADIASKKLGLSTARNNIYVTVEKPAKTK
jgi:cell division protein FtsL